MKLLKLVTENISLKKKLNTLNLKCIALNEELLTLYRKKSNLIDERDLYKELATKYKNDLKEIKKSNLESNISKINKKRKEV